MMSELIIYCCWYLTLLGTGVYLLAQALAGRGHLPKTIAWAFLWNTQLASGLTITSLPFIHFWMAAH